MNENKSNIVLIGMPAAGKSTVGVLLAKAAAYGFVDTDILIQTSIGQELQQVVESEGHLVLRDIEAQVIQNMQVENHVIATGGSAVYCEQAMNHLKGLGTVIFLDVSLAEIKRRLGDFSRRGIAKSPEQSIDDLLLERNSLYQQHADITISTDGLSAGQVCDEILSLV